MTQKVNPLKFIFLVLVVLLSVSMASAASNIVTDGWYNQTTNISDTTSTPNYRFVTIADTSLNIYSGFSDTLNDGQAKVNVSIVSPNITESIPVQYIRTNITALVKDAAGSDNGHPTMTVWLKVCNSATGVCNQTTSPLGVIATNAACGGGGAVAQFNLANTTALSVPGNGASWYLQVFGQLGTGCNAGAGTGEINLNLTDAYLSDASGNYLSRISSSGTVVSLNSPADNSVQSSPIFNASAIPTTGGFNLTNATLYVYNTNGTLLNRTVKTVTGSVANGTTWTVANLYPSNVLWHAYFCSANSTATRCGSSTTNYTLMVGATNISSSASGGTYETKTESFNLNVSLPSGNTLASALLYYNSSSYSATITQIAGSNYSLVRTLDIPLLGTSTQNYFWSLTFANGYQQNTSTQTQNVGAINLTLCGAAPFNIPYINFTFKDETTLVSKNASLDSSTWDYYLGSGAFNKTLVASNSTTNQNYAFCLNPSNQTLYAAPIFKYSASGYPQRTYQPSILTLTSTVTSTVLYLLASGDGIYSSTQVIDANSLRPITGVYVTMSRLINNVLTVIEQGYTDSSGLVTFWVNPNYDHVLQASATDYVTQTETIRPTQSTYTLALTPLASSNASFASDTAGIKYIFYPKLGTTNIGSTTFGFNVTALNGNLEGCRISLVNGRTGSILSTATSTNAGATCNISTTYAVTSGQIIFGKLSIDTTNSSGYFLIDADAKWIAIDKNVTWSNTIISTWDDLNDLAEFGDDDNKIQFTKFIVFFFIFTLLLGVLTFTTGWEINSPVASVLIVWCLVAIGSFAGFFDFDFGSGNLDDKFTKHAVLFIYSLFAGGFIMNQLRRTE